MANKYRLEGESKSFSIRGVGRFFSEIIIVFIGIYLAFALDNWKNVQKEQELEAKYLRELLNETNTNISELKADQEARTEQLRLFGHLLESQNRSVGADTLRAGVGQLLRIRIFSPTEAVYEDLVSSGNLRLIKNEEIRQTIILNKRWLSRANVTEGVEERLIEEKIESYLIDEGVLSLLEPLGDVDQINTSQQQIDRIIRVLLNDREFIDLVYLRRSRLSDVIYFERPLSDNLNRLKELLESEIKNLEKDL